LQGLVVDYHVQRLSQRLCATTEEFERAVEAESSEKKSDADPQELLVRSGLDEDVEKALHSLPDEFRAALLLVDVNELSYEEAARALEVPIGTVRSRLSRARSMMRYALAQVMRTRGSAGS
jgi:RNA polymerase sigma factor (sigma-70 family)